MVFPPSAIGATASIRPRGLADDGAMAIEQVVTGEAMRPPSPVELKAAAATDGGLILTWTPRSRFGWSRPAGADVPLGESKERYRVTVQGSSGTITVEASEPQASIPAEAVTGMVGPVTISVVQIGDFAVSRPTTTSFDRSA